MSTSSQAQPTKRHKKGRDRENRMKEGNTGNREKDEYVTDLTRDEDDDDEDE